MPSQNTLHITDTDSHKPLFEDGAAATDKLPTSPSAKWLDEMFRSPCARQVKGRTKWTHRHAIWVEALGRLCYVESRNELIALLLLEHLFVQRKIQRFKEQPFTTALQTFGYEYTPDFCAQDSAGTIYVIEIKTKRFVAREQELKFEDLKAKFGQIGMKFLVWTDAHPLVRPLRHNMLRMRRMAKTPGEAMPVATLVEALRSEGPLPLRTLYQRGWCIEEVAHSAWHGHVHFPLLNDITGNSMVSLQAPQNLFGTLFSAEPDIEKFWNALGDAA